jgi:nucleoside transporter
MPNGRRKNPENKKTVHGATELAEAAKTFLECSIHKPNPNEGGRSMMNTKTYAQLSVMMFLEFFVWGAWYVTVGNYMANVGMTEVIYWAYTVGPIGGIISPFFLGMIADRFFATEKVLGVMHIIGGIALFCAPFAQSAPSTFILLLLIHMLCYMPTVGLANTLAFHHISNQEKQFPIIRVFGTIGWIVANIIVSYVLNADQKPLPLHIAGVSGILMGLYSFTLPHTPPPAAGQKVSARQILGLDALAKLKSASFNVFILCSFLICIPLAAYYSYAPVFVNASGISNPAFKMSFGQMSEVLFMLALPVFFARFGVKWTLLVGMLAWVLRYLLFSIAAPASIFWMIMTGVILHGVCYDFFFVAGQIYVDKKAIPEIRGQAQGFIVLVTYGVGMLIGAQVTGWLFNAIVTGNGAEVLSQWRVFWALPAVFAGAVLVLFASQFKEQIK